MNTAAQQSAGWDWDKPLPAPEEKVKLPEGPAKFEVLKFERARKPMGKLGTCNVACLKLIVTSLVDQELTDTKEVNLPLHPKMVWKHYQFFAAIGQYTHGDVEQGKAFTPDWSKVEGSEGLCMIKDKPWTDSKGNERKDPDIDAFIDQHGRSRASDEAKDLSSLMPAAGGDSESFDNVPF